MFCDCIGSIAQRMQAIDGVGEMGYGEKRWGRFLTPSRFSP